MPVLPRRTLSQNPALLSGAGLRNNASRTALCGLPPAPRAWLSVGLASARPSRAPRAHGRPPPCAESRVPLAVSNEPSSWSPFPPPSWRWAFPCLSVGVVAATARIARGGAACGGAGGLFASAAAATSSASLSPSERFIKVLLGASTGRKTDEQGDHDRDKPSVMGRSPPFVASAGDVRGTVGHRCCLALDSHLPSAPPTGQAP